MRIYEATNLRIHELRKEKRLTEYALIYQTGMPPSTVKSILHGKSQNPGIVRTFFTFVVLYNEIKELELFQNSQWRLTIKSQVLK